MSNTPNEQILSVAPDYENDELYAAVIVNPDSKIVHCLLKPQVECSEFESVPQEYISRVFLDGERLYIVKDNAIYWADKNAEEPFFSYVAPAGTLQVAKVINESIYAFSQSGIRVFIDNGMDSPSYWSSMIKPSMLSVKGGQLTKSWDGELYLVKEKTLYRSISKFVWQKKVDKVSAFAVTGNYGLIFDGTFTVNLVDLADIIDGVIPNVLGSIEGPSVKAMTADTEKVFIATLFYLYECSLPTEKDINIGSCAKTSVNAVVNDLTNVPSLKEVLVCAENGLYRWKKGTNKLTQITTAPCKAATFVEDNLYMINDKGEISMLDAYGKVVKQLCQKLQPMKSGLEVDGNYFYISDMKRGVVRVHKKLFSEVACPTTE